MNVNLQIDRLILDGIDLTPSQRAHLQSTISAELTQLFIVQGLPSQWENGGAIASLPSGKLEVSQGIDPSQMGQQIAQQIYERLAQ